MADREKNSPFFVGGAFDTALGFALLIGIILLVKNFGEVLSFIWVLVGPVVVALLAIVPFVAQLSSLTDDLLHGALILPAFWPAVSGILAGIVIAWVRMAFRSKKPFEPLLSAIFSLEPVEHGGLQFLWRFIADVAVGYLVMFVFASFELVPDTVQHAVSPLASIDTLIIGGMGGGAFGGPDTFGFAVFILLAILFAAMVVGAIIGGGIGGTFGFGLWTTHLIHGGAEGATVHLLLGMRNTPGPGKHFLGYIFHGALSGALEASLIGAICGCITDSGYLLNIWWVY